MKLKTTIISIASVLVIGLTAILLYCFWPAIKGTVNNSKYYTQEELQESYDKGYEDGCKTETELTAQVKYYKSLVDEYYIQVNTLNDEITMLTKTKQDYETQISNIENQKANLQTQVDNLITIKSNNETTIASLNSQITSLQNQVTNLTNSNEDKSEQISTLNNQITTLQNTISQLQTTNDMNVATITSLNTQIANLNNQISDMTLQSQNSQSQINALNNKISELQASVSYYESYIAQLENGEQVVATFEFDGSVYNIQIVNKGSKLSVTTPTSTTYKIFNGWTVNGSKIDLSTYTITANTKIVADVTYKYDVKFKVDDTVYDSQIITKNNCATVPTKPTKDGYEFDGWSLNGVDVITDISTKQVTQNVTYTAVFTKLYAVTFIYENTTKATQSVRNGNYATAITIIDTDYKVFNGWTVNGSKIDLSTYKIVTNTTFIADIIYKYDVKFKVDDTVFNSQIITKNNCATLPTNPTKDGYEFDGWSLNGVDIISNITSKQVTENATYVAVFTKLYNVTFIVNGKILEVKQVRNGSYVSNVNNDYTWTLNGTIVNFNDYVVSSDVTFISFSELKGLEIKTWSGLNNFGGNYIWTDGENIYCSKVSEHYVLDKETSTWKQKTWNGFTEFASGNIWTDGTNYYCSRNASQYILDKETSTWEQTTWNGLDSFIGSDVWTDGTNYYYSSGEKQYVLNRTTDTWETKTWNGLNNFYTMYMWTDGENTYISINSFFNENGTSYILNKDTSTWESITWNGFNNVDGSNVWTDGKDCYYSLGSKQYVFDKETNTWNVKTWNGFTNVMGSCVWTDGVNYYYSYDSNQYVFIKG